MDTRSVEDVLSLAALLSDNSVAPAGQLAPREGEALGRVWQRLRSKYPSTFETTNEEVAIWHRFQAEECETERDWQTATFHWRKLLAMRPDDELVANRLMGAQTNSQVKPSSR